MAIETTPYGVYVQTDEKGRIIAINSNAFLDSLQGWTKIDEGYGDKYCHAQGNYLPGSLTDERGVYRYKLMEGQAKERTREEMDGDYIPPLPPGIPLESRVEQVEGKTRDLQSAMEALIGGIAGA